MWYQFTVQGDCRSVAVFRCMASDEGGGGFGWCNVQSIVSEPLSEKVEVFLLERAC